MDHAAANGHLVVVELYGIPWKPSVLTCWWVSGCLPLEHGSDRPQTLSKRVSDDLQLSMFRRQKKRFDENFRNRKHVFRQLRLIWEELGNF